ncbi:MAG: hypothetical protein CVU95_11195 [Firmicutes bacterium HGW-Firmicutes-2]|nr:MAG: hypothetical protein CVU95_11195 [Firmicutes bacterium HGW-Firmicutes-2]
MVIIQSYKGKDCIYYKQQANNTLMYTTTIKKAYFHELPIKICLNTSKTFPVEPFRNMSRAHNEAKLLFLFSRKVILKYSALKYGRIRQSPFLSNRSEI